MNTITYLSLSEASQELGLTRAEVRKLVVQGVLTGYSFGKAIRINSRDLQIFIKKSKVNHGKDI